MSRDQLSERTMRRLAAEQKSARSLDVDTLPVWLWPGRRVIPAGGVARRVELIHIHDPVNAVLNTTLAFGKAAA